MQKAASISNQKQNVNNSTMKPRDITDHLNKEQFKELEELASEHLFKDVVSFQEFKKATEKWRYKNENQKPDLNTKNDPSKNPY
ncbi:MAG: hypothetical protein GXC73_04840 [Chitinophagaceae bacterium]|nr:hypothetical protein [Chitinophagaceae bacterium]